MYIVIYLIISSLILFQVHLTFNYTFFYSPKKGMIYCKVSTGYKKSIMIFFRLLYRGPRSNPFSNVSPIWAAGDSCVTITINEDASSKDRINIWKRITSRTITARKKITTDILLAVTAWKLKSTNIKKKLVKNTYFT